MATNKHAMIRYQALDKCFSNRGRNFYINDLIEACNEELYNYTGEDKYSDPDNPAISRRQVYDDISLWKVLLAGKFLLNILRTAKRLTTTLTIIRGWCKVMFFKLYFIISFMQL